MDGLDAGFRLFGALGGTCIWVLIIALMATSRTRSSGWLIAAVLCGLPLVGALAFACLTCWAFLVDRSYARAQREGYTPDPDR